MNIAYLNIGSNRGHRQSNLDKAVALLHHYLPDSTIEVSDTVESEPWGFVSAAKFLNIGVRIATSLSPMELLNLTQTIEREISPASHRDTSGNYLDRIIDIDIIAMTRDDGSDYIIESDRLTLPHPLMHRRLFVLKPMAQLAPLWHHPTLHLTANDLIVNLC